jgi:hypothetical protein
MGKGFSGSTIKSWFQYRCERKTRYEVMDAAELAAVPVAKDEREKPWAVLGVDYEDRVVARLSRETSVLRPRTVGEGLEERISAPFLRGAGGATYAAQMNLRPRVMPAAWAGSDLYLRRSLSDLVKRDLSGPVPMFRVIDIKATRNVRAFHKIQVAFYARLLEALLAELGAPGVVDLRGEIWRIPDNGSAEGDDWEPDEFALQPYLRLVDEFCGRTLQQIAAKEVSANRDETFFHVYFKCEQCSYLPHCGAAIAATRPPHLRDISAVAGLTHESKRTLNGVGVRSVAQLAGAGAGIGRMDGAGWSLSRRAETLIVRAQALRDDAVQPIAEAQTFLMPPRLDASLYLVADHDPVDDGLVTLGYRYVRGETVREHIEVLVTPDRAAEADALVTVFGKVIADLKAIDAENAAREMTDEPGLQAHLFLYEPTEAVGLQDAVSRHLDDPRIRVGLLDMVRLFPPEEIVPEPEFRGMQHLPATALRSVVEQLFAVPATAAYDLRQVSQALAADGKIVVAYQPQANFERPFSALLAMEVSRALREGRPGAPGAEEVRADVVSRLAASQAVAEWLQAEHTARVAAGGRPMLRLNKSPFRMQASFNPLDAGDLDVLRAFELLENRAGMLDTLIRLAQPASTRRDSGRAVGPMRLLGATEGARDTLMIFAIPPDAQDADVAAGAFGLVLSDGEPDFVLEPRLWPDLACDLRPYRRGDAGNILRVTVRREVFRGPTFQSVKARAREDGWWLDRTFVDLNSPKVDAFLTYLSAGVAA